ncbi:MAG: hypothetical protein ACSW8H_06895 [bacterium]
MKSTFQQTAARVIRILSIPPVMATGLVILLALKAETFRSPAEIALTILFLAIFPVLAYPLSAIIPSVRAKGREGQRNLAFITTAVGYLLGMIYGIFISRNPSLIMLYGIYLLSVILLLIANKLLRLRASGHGCSVTGPLFFLGYFLGPIGLALGSALFAFILWASVVAKRHTVREFISGACICLLSIGSVCRIAGHML